MATSPPFAPIAHSTSLRSHVEDSVAAAIVSGQLPPGELVSVPGLALQFDVSATPVREAMINLQQRGLVEPVRNKGFRVTDVSRKDLEDIVHLRQLIEVPVVRDLTPDFSLAPRERLRELARGIVDAADQANMAVYLAADIDFHRELLALSGNDRLVALVTDLRRQTRLTGLSGMLHTERLRESAREHDRLLDLLEAGDAAAAEELMHRHIGHVLGWWSGNPEQAAEPGPARHHGSHGL